MPHYLKNSASSPSFPSYSPPSFSPGPQLKKLEFTANSVRNTTIATPDDLFYYEVVTRFWHPKITKINILNPDTQELRTVAEVEKVGSVDGQPKHRVRFLKSKDGENVGKREKGEKGEKAAEWGEWISDQEFLKSTPEKVGGSFVDNEGIEYRWKTHNRRLQLVRADDETKDPLVLYHPHHRYFFVLRMSRHASLDVKPEATKLLDRLIASYIIVERRRRAYHRLLDI